MTDTETLTLTDFLLARLVEDEVIARAAVAGPWEFENAPDGFPPMVTTSTGIAVADTFDKPRLPDAAHIARHNPARVLADVAAKRRIVELLGPVANVGRGINGGEVALALAQPYADHPDFREAWRVQA